MNKNYYILGLFVLIFILSSNNVESALTDNLVSYFPLNEASGNQVNSTVRNISATATNTNVVDGIIGKARSPSTSAGFVNISSTNLSIYNGNTFTHNMWCNITSFDADDTIFSSTDTNIADAIAGSGTANNSFYVARYNGGWNQLWYDYTSNLNKKTMITVIYASTYTTLYINGNLINNVTYGARTGVASNKQTNIMNGDFRSPTRAVNGWCDEWGTWSVPLGSTDITSLYAGGLGFAYPFTPSDSIIISSISPTNYTFTENLTQLFTFNVTAISGTYNSTLWLNNNNSYGINNSFTTAGTRTIIASTLPSGRYQWWINASSNTTNSVITEKRDIYIVGTTTSTNCVINNGNWYFVPDGCTSST